MDKFMEFLKNNTAVVAVVGKQIITMGFVSLFYGGIPLVFGNPEFIPFESFYNTTKAGVESNVVLRAFGGEIVLTKHALICAAITAVVLAALFLLLLVRMFHVLRESKTPL